MQESPAAEARRIVASLGHDTSAAVAAAPPIPAEAARVLASAKFPAPIQASP